MQRSHSVSELLVSFRQTHITSQAVCRVLLVLKSSSTECLRVAPLSQAAAITDVYVCVCSVQLAAQWLVIGSGEISLHLQREIGLSTFLGAIQTYCLKVGALLHVI